MSAAQVGLLWFKFEHKGCGTFANAHHAFLCWLTLTVWAQAVRPTHKPPLQLRATLPKVKFTGLTQTLGQL